MNGIYLIGAGRSGTTLLASILGNHEQVNCLGELHQFWDYLLGKDTCSCGKPLSDCATWAPIYAYYTQHYSTDELREIQKYQANKERHSQAFAAFFKKDTRYTQTSEEFFRLVSERYPNQVFLDSSKYVSRGVRLSKSEALEVKYIYMVRDVRGVINSFAKNVQTPKKMLAAITYYILINVLTHVAVWRLGKENVMVLRYEDLVSEPRESLTQIGGFLTMDFSEQLKKLENGHPFTVPHIVGGNRMKKASKITMRPDNAWHKNITGFRRVLAYVVCWPFMRKYNYKC